MRNKYVIFFIAVCAVSFGYISAHFVLEEYNKSLNNMKTVYFLQIAESNKPNENEFNDIHNKIILKENDKYYTYIGITTDRSEAERVKKMYDKDKIDIYIKEKNIDDDKYILELEQYDVLLRACETKDEVNNVFKSVLSTFEENISSV